MALLLEIQNNGVNFYLSFFFLLTNTVNEESLLTSISFGAYSSLWRGRRTVKHTAEAEKEASLLSVWCCKVLLHPSLEHSSANIAEKNVQEKVFNRSRPR